MFLDNVFLYHLPVFVVYILNLEKVIIKSVYNSKPSYILSNIMLNAVNFADDGGRPCDADFGVGFSDLLTLGVLLPVYASTHA